MLNEIKEKLEEIDNLVFYGMADDSRISDTWDYIVFGRRTMSASNNRTGYTDRYFVAVVREDYVPETLPEEVINKLLEIDGMRLASNDFAYDYRMKPNTNTVVEVLVLEFIRPRKTGV